VDFTTRSYMIGADLWIQFNVGDPISTRDKTFQQSI